MLQFNIGTYVSIVKLSALDEHLFVSADQLTDRAHGCCPFVYILRKGKRILFFP